MSIFKGSTELCTLGDLKIGDQDVQEVYVGSTKVFPCSSGKNLYVNVAQWGNSILLPLASTGLVLTKDFSLEYEGFIVGDNDYCNLNADHLGPDSYDWEFGWSLWYGNYQEVQPYAYFGINDWDASSDVNDDFPAPIIGYTGTWMKIRFDFDVSASTATVTFTNYRGVSAQFNLNNGYAPLTDMHVPDNLESHYQMDSWASIRNVKIWQETTLLAHWPIDDESSVSGQIRDVSGNGNHGTYRSVMDMTWDVEANRDTFIRFKVKWTSAGADGYVTPEDYPWLSCRFTNNTGVGRSYNAYWEYDPAAYETPSFGLHWSSAEQLWVYHPLLGSTGSENIYTTDYFLFVYPWMTDGPPNYDVGDIGYNTQYPDLYQSGDWYDSADAIALGSDVIYEVTVITEFPA